MNTRNLIAYREAAGLSPHALAQRAGIAAAMLYRIEAGQRSCRADTLRAIADALAAALNLDVGTVLKGLTDPA